MASTYGPGYESIWRDALLLDGFSDLFASLARELAGYRGISDAEAATRLEATWQRRWEIVGGAFPDSGDPNDLIGYYDGAESAVETSLYWHSLRPDRFALHSVAGLQTVQEFSDGPRIFEFGHGIGSAGLLLCRHRYDVVMGDVSSAYARFVDYRFSLRGMGAALFDLSADEPAAESFDAVVSFDVLEHVPDPLAVLARFERWLKPGGLLVMNVAFGSDPANPEHLLQRRRGFQDRIRSAGFDRIPSPTLLVYYKRRQPRVLRPIHRLRDTADAVVDDCVARWPQLGPVLRTHRLPPI